MNVLIVGRTRMSGSSRCIGGISQDGTPVRLLDSNGGHFDTTAPFQIGQVWDMTYTRVAEPRPPHTEDVLVSQYQFVRAEPNLRAHLLTRVGPWNGGIKNVFGGMLGYTSKNSCFVCQRLGIPAQSTGFWIPDRDLTLRAGTHYDYPDGNLSRSLAYVGEPQAVATLAAGTFVRVSLARWWKPPDADPSFEERCYLQLSGWF